MNARTTHPCATAREQTVGAVPADPIVPVPVRRRGSPPGVSDSMPGRPALGPRRHHAILPSNPCARRAGARHETIELRRARTKLPGGWLHLWYAFSPTTTAPTASCATRAFRVALRLVTTPHLAWTHLSISRFLRGVRAVPLPLCPVIASHQTKSHCTHALVISVAERDPQSYSIVCSVHGPKLPRPGDASFSRGSLGSSARNETTGSRCCRIRLTVEPSMEKSTGEKRTGRLSCQGNFSFQVRDDRADTAVCMRIHHSIAHGEITGFHRWKRRLRSNNKYHKTVRMYKLGCYKRECNAFYTPNLA